LIWGELKAGTKIGETEAVFPRIDKQKVMSEINSAEAVGGQPSADSEDAKRQDIESISNTDSEAKSDSADHRPPTTDHYIGIEDFLKVELRVGEIKVAERIPKADKLLRFEIDLGEDQPRQILAGLAEYYEPKNLSVAKSSSWRT
jgi:methionyl-tRNA synthetase